MASKQSGCMSFLNMVIIFALMFFSVLHRKRIVALEQAAQQQQQHQEPDDTPKQIKSLRDATSALRSHSDGRDDTAAGEVDRWHRAYVEGFRNLGVRFQEDGQGGLSASKPE